MAIVRWDPFQLMRWPNIWEDEESYLPAADNNLDIFETETEVVARANMAGIPEDKVEITFDKGILWIRGQEETQEKEGKKYYRKATRSYSYKIAIPGNIDLKHEPAAVVKNGVVEITFMKAEEAKPKRISIKSSK